MDNSFSTGAAVQPTVRINGENGVHHPHIGDAGAYCRHLSAVGSVRQLVGEENGVNCYVAVREEKRAQ